MKQSIKYTRKTITEVPLFILDTKTGEILSGSFKKEKLKKGDSRSMAYEMKFDVDVKKDIDWILFCVEEIFLRRINIIYLKLNDIIFGAETGFRSYMDGHSDNTHSEGSGTYLFFSSLEKANLVLKKFILPRLIKEDTARVNDLRDGYMKVVDRLNDLEEKLKQLMKKNPRIVNVIEMIDGTISSIDTFIIPHGTAPYSPVEQKIVGQAEKLFSEIAQENGMNKDELDTYLEDGYFETGDYKVVIHWSNENTHEKIK